MEFRKSTPVLIHKRYALLLVIKSHKNLAIIKIRLEESSLLLKYF
jgi:hypothetical protein